MARSEHAAPRWLWLLSKEDRTIGRRSRGAVFDPIAVTDIQIWCGAQGIFRVCRSGQGFLL